METNFHNPVRYPDETVEQYKSRRSMSKRLALRTKLLGQPKPSEYKTSRRTLVAAVGIRQAKKAMRKAREQSNDKA